jgi:hypothetical protein
VRRSTAYDRTRSEAGYCGKMLRRERVRKPEEEICSAIRRRARDRGGAREVFLLWRVVSCGSTAPRWRTKLHLGSGEPLDDYHRSSTLGAEPKITGVLGAWRVLLCGWRRAERLKAKRHEAIRKQVQQEATEEFIERESHPSLFIFMSGVTPTKGDFLVGEGDQSVIGDGYTMGVTTQITEHMLRASERWFRVDHPILSK